MSYKILNIAVLLWFMSGCYSDIKTTEYPSMELTRILMNIQEEDSIQQMRDFNYLRMEIISLRHEMMEKHEGEWFDNNSYSIASGTRFFEGNIEIRPKEK